MEFTMLLQMCRRGWLDAILHDSQSNINLTDNEKKFMKMFQVKESWSDDVLHEQLSGMQEANILSKASSLSSNEYNMLLTYLQQTEGAWHSYNDFPHSLNTRVLPLVAQRPTEIHHNNRTYSCYRTHRGNSAVWYRQHQSGQLYSGYIQTIWQLPLQGRMRTFIVVQQFKPLVEDEEAKSPFHSRPLFYIKIFDASLSDNFEIIEQHQILCHLVTYRRPAGTYDINQDILVVCASLNRGWKTI